MLSLPKLMPPASRSRRAAVHSPAPTKYSGVRVPHDVGKPCRWQRSLKPSGTPWSGPRQRPAAASASRERAAWSAASSSRRMKARIRPSHLWILARQRSTASTGEIRRLLMSAARPDRLSSLIPRRLLLALEGGDEPRRLFGERELARQALDDARHVRQLHPVLPRL